MAAARRSKPLLALRSTKLDKIFTYGIVAMRRTNFAHLGRTSGNNGGWCGWGRLAQVCVDGGGLWGSSGYTEGTSMGIGLR
jgi:hypothetical protein